MIKYFLYDDKWRVFGEVSADVLNILEIEEYYDLELGYHFFQ